ncbi:MAG: hypothetical protein OXU45_08685 [Candidatus Melainabacteria bacterium]|nr:hypothetical protein [Candidatus Melainabacteria bacterium]
MATFVANFAMAQSLYQETHVQYQTACIANIDSDAHNQDQELSLNRRRSKTIFWFLLAAIVIVPLAKSCVVNIFDLSQNIGKNIELQAKRKQLLTDQEELKAKMREFHSFLGMKRTIKEEIKVIEANEILIKITP